MNALVEQTAFGVTTSSRTVAEVFEKEHYDVLRAIDGILDKRPEQRGRNFTATSVTVPMPNNAKREVRAYDMNRDGFTLLAMGFTGEKALDWKIAYIEAFNRMEAELAGGLPPAPAQTALDVADTRHALALVREVRLLFGVGAARRMWPQLGLPTPPADYQAAVSASGAVMTWCAPATVGDWLDECAVRDGDAKTSAADLYRNYVEWCADQQRVAETQRRFGDTLARMGFDRFKSRSGNIWRRGLRLLA